MAHIAPKMPENNDNLPFRNGAGKDPKYLHLSGGGGDNPFDATTRLIEMWCSNARPYSGAYRRYARKFLEFIREVTLFGQFHRLFTTLENGKALALLMSPK